MNKRHAKPTSAQIMHRIYRQQIALRAEFASLQSGQRMLSDRMEAFRVLADHCARLLREKDTLAKIVARYQGPPSALRQANDFMSHLTRRVNDRATPCGFVNTHRPGIQCSICGAV